jgi:2-amino-4-hydroxy-6-hydroxymethyldihydropteridine diphosphokinase
MPRAAIALGSNLGQRLAQLQAAVHLLQRLARPGEALLRAPVYQTKPLRCPAGSPDFYNTVVELDYDGTPLELLAHTQAIESQLGRTRSAARNAPRTIDIDLLYFGSQTCDAAELVLPHPRLTQRRFVLQPLADIRPHLILPGHHLTIAALLARLRSTEPAVTLVEADW